MSTDVQQKFYNLFWKSEECQELFLLHKEEMLMKEEIEISKEKHGFYLPRFVLSNSLKRQDAVARIEQRLEYRRIDLNKSLQDKSEKNLTEEKITLYFNERLSKPFELVTKKLSGNSFTKIRFVSEIMGSLSSEKKLMKLLHKYQIVPREITNFKELSEWIESSVEKELKKIIKPQHFSDVLSAVDEIASHYSNYHYSSLLEAHEFHADTILQKDFYKNQLNMFDDLYECGVLIGVSIRLIMNAPIVKLTCFREV